MNNAISDESNKLEVFKQNMAVYQTQFKIEQTSNDDNSEVAVPMPPSSHQMMMSHTSFVMKTSIKVSDDSLFRADSESFVEIECHDASSRAADHLSFELFNLDLQVDVKIKTKTLHNGRLVRAYFCTSAGIHRLVIQFNRVNIPGSPFLFVVVSGTLLDKFKMLPADESFNTTDDDIESALAELATTPVKIRRQPYRPLMLHNKDVKRLINSFNKSKSAGSRDHAEA